jgi:tRNA pseudouridine32 synthase/23S rRNA pseudouridine746 synthase
MAILGDDLYGTHKERMFLHAERLVFLHPNTLKEIKLECLAPF